MERCVKAMAQNRTAEHWRHIENDTSAIAVRLELIAEHPFLESQSD